jgi:hypothetical protein
MLLNSLNVVSDASGVLSDVRGVSDREKSMRQYFVAREVIFEGFNEVLERGMGKSGQSVIVTSDIYLSVTPARADRSCSQPRV